MKKNTKIRPLYNVRVSYRSYKYGEKGRFYTDNRPHYFYFVIQEKIKNKKEFIEFLIEKLWFLERDWLIKGQGYKISGWCIGEGNKEAIYSPQYSVYADIEVGKWPHNEYYTYEFLIYYY
jgi:hypothetical protein